MFSAEKLFTLQRCSKSVLSYYKYPMNIIWQQELRWGPNGLFICMMMLKNLSSHRATDIYSLPLNTFVLFKYQNRIHFVIAESL